MLYQVITVIYFLPTGWRYNSEAGRFEGNLCYQQANSKQTDLALVACQVKTKEKQQLKASNEVACAKRPEQYLSV